MASEGPEWLGGAYGWADRWTDKHLEIHTCPQKRNKHLEDQGSVDTIMTREREREKERERERERKKWCQ